MSGCFLLGFSDTNVADAWTHMEIVFLKMPRILKPAMWLCVSAVTLYTIHYEICRRCNDPYIVPIVETDSKSWFHVTNHRVPCILVLQGSCRLEG